MNLYSLALIFLSALLSPVLFCSALFSSSSYGAIAIGIIWIIQALVRLKEVRGSIERGSGVA
jgi:peptidoglycan biosynthesis protein MviN/MurJ (putative lipid II flippase)